MARNNNGLFIEPEDLNKEIDFDFFDDGKSELSDPNNNTVIKSSPIDSKSDFICKKQDELKNDSSEKPDFNMKQEFDNDLPVSDTSNSISNHSSSRLSKESPVLSVNSSELKEFDSKMSKSSLSNMSSDSHIEESSGEESDVTNVSSLESGNSQSEKILETSKKPKQSTKSSITPISKYHTHFNTTEDADLISTEVILQAMMRIHEERRLVQKMKPKWVDPNTKDYSVSGITSKLNLVPERIVSMPKKNIRSNPFYRNNVDIEKRLYHTAINRSKDQYRIDKENREIVMRLQRIRPSPGITRDELLKEYSKINRFSIPMLNRSRMQSSSSSCRPRLSGNSTSSSCLKSRPSNNSTMVSRFADSRLSNSQMSEPKRAMSAGSSASHNTRQSNSAFSTKKRH